VAAAHRRKAHLRRERIASDVEAECDPDPGPDPEAATATKQGRERLSRVLDTLPPERRAVFVMFEIEGIPAVEIATMLGVPAGTVYSRLSVAREEFAAEAARLSRREKWEGP
jgi:RNA polymerase sigma-70 factor (ECF subfamily)